MAFRAAATHLDDMHREGLLSQGAWEALRPAMLARVEDCSRAVRELQLTHPALTAEEVDSARRELLRAQRSALMGLRRDGVISEEAFETLAAEIDASLDRWEDRTAPSKPKPHTNATPGVQTDE